MDNWENRFKERLEDHKMELPVKDWDIFLAKKRAHDYRQQRRRPIIVAAVGIPAAAAIFCTLLLSIHLLLARQPVTITSDYEYVVLEEELAPDSESNGLQ